MWTADTVLIALMGLVVMVERWIEERKFKHDALLGLWPSGGYLEGHAQRLDAIREDGLPPGLAFFSEGDSQGRTDGPEKSAPGHAESARRP